ncbi:hypothetical protein ACLI4Q_05220 [Natrialbaceae archaeon A-CW1-1]
MSVSPSNSLEFDARPSITGAAVALLFGALVTLLATMGSMIATPFAFAGLLSIGYGVTVGSTRAVDTGTAGFVPAIAIGTAGSLSIPLTVSAVVCLYTAWDVAHNAIGVGEQLGRWTETTRLELIHAGGSLVVGALTAGIVLLFYQVTVEGLPFAALVFVALGGVLLLWILDHWV